MSANCDVIVVLLIYGQFGAIRMPGSESIVSKSYIFINSNLLSYKNWKQNEKISNIAFTLLLWVKVLFFQKNADFLQKKFNKIKRALVLKSLFSETTDVWVLTY